MSRSLDKAPEWLTQAYRKWGAEIAAQKLGRRRVRDLTGLTRAKAVELIVLVKEIGPPQGVSETVTEAPKPQKDHWLHSKSYVYDKDTDKYITFLSSCKKPLVVPGERHRAMKRAYSNWDGQPSTINEVCREFSIPRAWFEEYRRIHGWTHDAEPYTAEQLLTEDVDDLVEDALQSRRQLLHRKFEIEKWNQIKTQAEKWVRFESTVLEALISAIEAHAPDYTVPKLRLYRASQPFSVVVGPSDLHWGMYAWGSETGAGYTREIAEHRLLTSTERVLSRLPGQPERFYLAFGGDFFHTDNDQGTTTKGTKLDIDGSPAEILVSGCEMARVQIDLLRQVAPVKVILVPGNHDQYTTLALMLYLHTWYRSTDDVEVVMHHQPRHYCQCGNTLMGFHHGTSMKPDKMAPIMATEARELWGVSKHHVFFGGHLHHERVVETGGITYYQMPSLAGTDRWHSRMGFTTSSPAMMAYLIDHDEGVTGTLRVTPPDQDE